VSVFHSKVFKLSRFQSELARTTKKYEIFTTKSDGSMEGSRSGDITVLFECRELEAIELK
jgi:hypothetical protein